MKVLSLALIAVAGSFVHATDFANLDSAFKSLSEQSKFTMILRGTETKGRDANDIQVNTYVDRDPVTGIIRFDRYSYVNRKLIHRVIGDGVALYDFDPTKLQYTVHQYGAGTSTTNVYQLIASLSNGNEIYPSKVLSDMERSLNKTWAPWLPLTTIVANNDTVTLGDDLEGFEIKMLPVTSETWQFTTIAGWRTLAARSTSWLMEFTMDFVPEVVDFKFRPPAGAKVVTTQGSTKVGGNG